MARSKRTKRTTNRAHRPPQAPNRWRQRLRGESVIERMSYNSTGHWTANGPGHHPDRSRLMRPALKSKRPLSQVLLVMLATIYTTLDGQLEQPNGRLVGASGVAPTIDYSHNMRVLKLPKSVRPGELIYRLRASDGDQNDQLHFGVAGAQGRALLDIVQVPGNWKEADVYLRHRLETPLDLEGAESGGIGASKQLGPIRNHQGQRQQEQLLASATQLDDPLYTAVYNVTIFVADATNKTTQIESTILVTNDDLLEGQNNDETSDSSEGNQSDSASAGYETSSTLAGDLQEQTKYLQSSGSSNHNQQLANSSLISRIPLGLPGSNRVRTNSHQSQQPASLSPFIRPRHVFAVAENGQAGESIGFLTVRESDKSDLPVRFELRGQGSDHFDIRYVFGPRGQSRAELVLSRPVDYERQNLFRLKVLALNAWTNAKYDTRNVATLDIVIAVGDVQDTPPHFKQLPQALALNSRMRPGDLVARFEAEDGDYADQRPIGFALDANSPLSSFFTIDKLSGELRLARPWQELSLQQPSLMMRLAASANPLNQFIGQQPLLAAPWLMRLTVFASELPDTTSYDHLWPAMFARAELPLQLVDLVNEPPQLVGGLLTETSGAAPSTSLTVPTLRAFVREFANGDKPSEEVAPGHIERVNSEGSPAGQLVQWYVSKNYSTGGESSSPPVGGGYQQDSAAQLLAQLAKIGHGRPIVVDFGQGSNGTFELLLEGPDAHLFELEPSHPVNKLTLFNLFVSPNANRSLFDFDALPSASTSAPNQQRTGAGASVAEPPTRSFHVEVVARDFGLPQRQTMRVKCLIDLIDVNDNAPQFDLDLYTFSIFENAQMGQVLGSIRARDMDRLSGIAGVLSGQYQRVRYTSLTGHNSHLFRLDQESGLITLEGSLDRERQDHYLLLAEARDMSGQAANYTKILVNVLDVNDNAPVFSQSHYDAVLLPDGTFHQPLVVSALDSDEPSSANGQVAYEIIAGNQNEQFAIDALSGAIYPTGNLVTTQRPIQIPSILSEPIMPYTRVQGDHNNKLHPDQHGKILPSPSVPGREIEETTVPAGLRANQQHQPPLRLNWPRSAPSSSSFDSTLKPDQKPGDTSPVQRGFGHTLDRDELAAPGQRHNQAPKQQFDASKLAPVTTLVVRAHDFGIPLRSATCKVNIYNQALLSRSLSVILNGTAEQLEQRRDLIERSFGALTGSRVQIESIDALSDSSSISVARLKLAIPAGHSLIDLTDLSALMTAIDYKPTPANCPPQLQHQSLDHFRHPIHYITTGDRIYPVHQTPGASSNITNSPNGGAPAGGNTANTAIFADFSPLDNAAASQLERKLLFYIIIVGICILALLVIWMVYFCCREDQQHQQERRRRLKTIDSFEATTSVRGNARSSRGVQAESLEEDSLNSLGAGRKRGKISALKEGRGHFKGAAKSSSRTHLIEDEQQQAMGRSASQLDLDDEQQRQNANKTLAKTTALGPRHPIGNNLLKQQHQLSIPSNIKPEHYSMYNGQVWFEQGGLMRPMTNDHRGALARLSERRASSAPSIGAHSLDSSLHAIISGNGRKSAMSPVNSGLTTPPQQRGQFFPNTLGYAQNLANIASPSGGAYIYPTASGGSRQRNFLGSRSRGRVVPMSLVGRGGDFTNEAFEPAGLESAPGSGLVMVPFVAGQMRSATQGQEVSGKSRRRHHHRSSKSTSSSSASRSDSSRTLDEEDELDHESVLLDSDQELLGFDSTGTPIIATRTRQKAPETTTSYLLPTSGGAAEVGGDGGTTGASSPAATVINMSPTKTAPARGEVNNVSTSRLAQRQKDKDKAHDDGKTNETKVALPKTEPEQAPLVQETEKKDDKFDAAASSKGRKSLDLMSELNERLNGANKQRALKRQRADDSQQQEQSSDGPRQGDATTRQVIDQTTRVDTDKGSPGRQTDESSSVSERPIATGGGANTGTAPAAASTASATTTVQLGDSLPAATKGNGANETERRQAFAKRRASETMSCLSQSTISETTSELVAPSGAERDNRLGDMKNAELLEKQSIFALTYSGLATDKLPS